MCTSSWNGSPSVASVREVLVWVNLGFREHTELIIKNPRLSCNILLTPSLDPDWRRLTVYFHRTHFVLNRTRERSQKDTNSFHTTQDPLPQFSEERGF